MVKNKNTITRLNSLDLSPRPNDTRDGAWPTLRKNSLDQPQMHFHVVVTQREHQQEQQPQIIITQKKPKKFKNKRINVKELKALVPQSTKCKLQWHKLKKQFEER